MKIYTKTGDKGETGIIGKRVSKNSAIINLIGNLDELNASIGIALSFLTGYEAETIDELIHIQSIIFSIGGYFAGGRIKADFPAETKKLEKSIDKMDLE